ncbi:MAG: hypothetical protein KIT18_05205 [Burkholderiales bacterium]|nr:hypothetical protein [Burkholderiales bacterium]
MDSFTKGEKVVATTFDGGKVIRLVWEDWGNTVFLCSERQFEALQSGWQAPMPIGFPRGDVISYSGATQKD